MNDQKEDAKRLRDLARHTRAIAHQMSLNDDRRMLAEMADRYERLASEAEAREMQRP